MWKALRSKGIPEDVVSVLKELHTTPMGKLDKCNTFAVERGVRQGCVLGPLMFIILFDYLLKGVKGETKSLAYADDLVAESDTREQAESYLKELSEVFGQAQLEISTEKTEIMSINTDKTKPIVLNGKELKDVDLFEYLGSLVNKDGLAHGVVRKRVEKAKAAILKLRPALVSDVLTLRNKALIIEVSIKPVLLYGVETIVLRSVDVSKLEAVIHRAKRMSLKLESKKTMKNEVINDLIKTRPVAYDVANRKLQLNISYRSLKMKN